MKENQMFSGIKVVELASVLAGPSVGMFFAELGARVIKIENKQTNGDVTRNWKVKGEDSETRVSAYFASINYNKEYLFLDLANPEDKAIALEEIKSADIVLTNFKEGSAEKLQMDYETLKKQNNKLIYANLSGFPKGDNRPAFDVVLQAETGFMFMTGTKDSGPIKMPVALIDVLAAHQLKEGILCAMLQQVKSPGPKMVSVSLYDSALASLLNQASNFLMANHLPEAMGSAHPNIAPYGDVFYDNNQKALVLAVGTEKHFAELCKVCGIIHLLDDDRFNTNAQRVVHRVALNAILQARFAVNTRAFWLENLMKNGVPAGAIKNLSEVFEDTHAQSKIVKSVEQGVETQRMQSVVFEIES
jgi:crotonobetainyl-CoA:carnitine CoA-transferase CaiB-like acyl-CoA transferase